ncbi:two-partner secretion domain-containing protein [Aphanothece sacrum]|uniref:Filamentous hemagglutinin family outer membrane protein n=1 Tax=Aphanothece sacrum FPU1 TaxID=1920663 RepID=A0A401IKM9_APHSA|nr:filamentous hemagglutinin N-terminal domain-containing protein [Aphanothece sacrum]GBF81750.1 filamentous hemagglutinin family outer membrane protein [Aphanothece sacrum FPU1]GBF85108.1 filamentous hemagglutinin family outer membrane protein [Aphanothece sacrum FPU3]
MKAHDDKTLKCLYLLLSTLIVGDIIATPLVLAQVTSDGTLPTQIIPNNNQLVIIGGVQAGNNLFHSFSEFSVPANQEAFFNNSLTAQNIISRVTGNSVSNIQGLIRANGLANLILINPNGIIFGPNAQINIGGSFLASTADSLKFADGSQFSVTNTQNTPLLTMSVPVGLQFGGNPGSIVNNATNLQLNINSTFALVGGNISFSGATLQVKEGRVELGSVGPNSQVQVTFINPGFVLAYSGVNNFRDISLSGETRIAGNNSVIQLQGNKITLNQADIISTTEGERAAGDLIVNGLESVEIIGSRTSSFVSSLSAEVDSDATGEGGNIIVNTPKLILRDGAVISAGSGGEGAGGTVEINASDSIELIGTGFSTPSLLATNTVSSGNGGEVLVNTQRLSLQDGGQIEAFSLGTGRGGTVRINAAESIAVSGSGIVQNRQLRVPSRITAESGFQDRQLTGVAPGGSLSIKTGQLTVINGGIISASSLGQGNAGNVDIQAGSIFLNNKGIITASSEGTGNAGNLNIEAEQLTLNDLSEVSVTSTGFGQGGNLLIKAPLISLDNNSQLTATSQPITNTRLADLKINPNLVSTNQWSGNAGSLSLETKQLSLNNNSQVTVSSFGLGNGGNINIWADNILLDNNSELTAETASGEGGNIAIMAKQFLILRHHSQISTTAGTQGGGGNGGNIDIMAQFIVAVPNENSDIVANAFAGNGGNIRITAAGVFGIAERRQLTPLSDITASSQFGQVGTIGINRPDVDPQRSLAKLPTTLVDPKNLVTQTCSPGGTFTKGEFTITGRGGLPPNPNEFIPNSPGLTELGYPNRSIPQVEPKEGQPLAPHSMPQSRQPSATQADAIVEAQGWIVDANGKVVLTAQLPSVTPHSHGFMAPTCYDWSTSSLSLDTLPNHAPNRGSLVH